MSARPALSGTGALTAGFADKAPQPETPATAPTQPSGSPNSDALVFWADIFGAMAGDVQLIRIDGPDGRAVHEHETVLKDNSISWFAFSGLPRPSSGWNSGSYTGLYQLVRDGRVVVTMTRQVHIDDG